MKKSIKLFSPSLKVFNNQKMVHVTCRVLLYQLCGFWNGTVLIEILEDISRRCAIINKPLNLLFKNEQTENQRPLSVIVQK